ncbi:DUF421 domain-containing protein [Advenella mimigardefordensis]|uniref:Putative membrane protein n=1 Tax=Advenella mimigardefordensis (strain DSM 17166 / LMG 22922 / DPN7) TaxID=1247726 RepID=W0PFU8_ADVMD|nr:YetF domain-containing protein [Advenella mimigardefordensis]AHG64377.1 putative membrane protein [Advenella mimigardefordensis DPN7]
MAMLNEVFQMQQTFSEAFLRSTAIYWGIYLLFRFAGRRNIGSLGFADIVVVMLVSEAVGNGLSGTSDTVTDGLAVAAGIVLWSFLIDRLGYFFPPVSRLLSPDQLLLIKDGVLQLKNMRREYVTRGELLEQLRINGVADLAQVRRAYLETNGEISVITRDRRDGSGSTGTKPDTIARTSDTATRNSNDNDR